MFSFIQPIFGFYSCGYSYSPFVFTTVELCVHTAVNLSAFLEGFPVIFARRSSVAPTIPVGTFWYMRRGVSLEWIPGCGTAGPQGHAELFPRLSLHAPAVPEFALL